MNLIKIMNINKDHLMKQSNLHLCKSNSNNNKSLEFSLITEGNKKLKVLTDFEVSMHLP